jgi:Skp family chaperone for outer membrane proteins
MQSVIDFIKKYRKIILITVLIIACLLAGVMISRLAAWLFGTGGIIATMLARKKDKKAYEETQEKLDEEIKKNEEEIEKKVREYKYKEKDEKEIRSRIEKVRSAVRKMTDEEKEAYVKSLVEG